MKTLPPVTNRIQTITLSLGRGRFQHGLCPLATMLGARLALLLLFLCTALVQPYAATPFQWDFTGSLSEPRYSHTATLLVDGRVLVAGGAGPRPVTFPDPVLASTERYDPATGTWTITGNLNDARMLHTATLLPGGRVLVTGGWPDHTGRSVLASAELYDPATGNWTRTTSMAVPCAKHTATLLTAATGNGKVLVVGSHESSNAAQLYDQAAQNWSFTGATTTPRFGYHTATLLPNGKVLVAGGFDGINHVTASAELYDPATGNFTPTGSLATARRDHTATLLANGKVLVAGGTNLDTTLASAELYDPAAGNWTPTGRLNFARWRHTATLLCDGKVLVAGGLNNSSSVASAELYDPATGSWTFTGSLNNARCLHSATFLWDGLVLVAGGDSEGGEGGSLATAELYQTGLATGCVTPMPRLPPSPRPRPTPAPRP